MRFERLEVRIPFPPLFDMTEVQESNLLQQFQRTDCSFTFKYCFGGLKHAVADISRFVAHRISISVRRRFRQYSTSYQASAKVGTALGCFVGRNKQSAVPAANCENARVRRNCTSLVPADCHVRRLTGQGTAWFDSGLRTNGQQPMPNKLPNTCLPTWDVEELPEPKPLGLNNLAGFIGPSIVMCGMQIGGASGCSGRRSPRSTAAA